MGSSGEKNAIEQFEVIGLCLPASSRDHLSLAFPRSVLLNATLDLDDEVQYLCDLLGKVVIFSYIPAMHGRKWLRTSAVFHTCDVKVIGVHPHCTDALYDRALEAEFDGVIDADAAATVYRRAALGVLKTELWFPRHYLSRRTRESRATTSPGGLSEREADVLALLGSGITNQKIAESLYISRDTVRWHLRSIYAKLGVSDREAALRVAKNQIASLDASQQTVDSGG